GSTSFSFGLNFPWWKRRRGRSRPPGAGARDGGEPVARYEFFEHMADVGAVVRGVTLPRLFENASRAMFDLICDRRAVRPRCALRIVVRGSSLEDLLVRWLSELLLRLEAPGLLFPSFVVERV